VKLNFAKCPYADFETKDIYFFMENLKHSGFVDEVDKKAGLDMNHTKVALSELAR